MKASGASLLEAVRTDTDSIRYSGATEYVGRAQRVPRHPLSLIAQLRVLHSSRSECLSWRKRAGMRPANGQDNRTEDIWGGRLVMRTRTLSSIFICKRLQPFVTGFN
jgi:hypothetical protein